MKKRDIITLIKMRLINEGNREEEIMSKIIERR